MTISSMAKYKILQDPETYRYLGKGEWTPLLERAKLFDDLASANVWMGGSGYPLNIRTLKITYEVT